MFYRDFFILWPMYFIRKYSNGWAIHNDDTGYSRLLTDAEKEHAKETFPELADEKVVTVYFDRGRSWATFWPQVESREMKKPTPSGSAFATSPKPHEGKEL